MIIKEDSSQTKNNTSKRYPDGRVLRRSLRVRWADQINAKIEEQKTGKGKINKN